MKITHLITTLVFICSVSVIADTLEGKIDLKGDRYYIQVGDKQTEIRPPRESKKLPELFKLAYEKNSVVELTGDIGKDGVFYCKKFRTVEQGPKVDAVPSEKKKH